MSISDQEFEKARGVLAKRWKQSRDQISDHEVRWLLGLPEGPEIECLTGQIPFPSPCAPASDGGER